MTDSAQNQPTPLQKAFAAIQLLKEQLDRSKQQLQEPIAIIGMSCRAPGANNPEELWQLIRDGKDAITDIPKSRWDAQQYYDPRPGTPGKSYTLRGGFVENIEGFDADFFTVSAREAEGMDPQQRLLLEVAWEALENSNIPPSSLIDSSTGVFVGVTSSDYGLLQATSNQDEVNPYFNTGTPLNACAGRISYVLGLQGPSIAVDTACSSSLTAIHLACNALRAKDCDMALACGVNLTLSPLLNVTLSAAGMMSADGKCKTFSEEANGYVRGEGCGIVTLKRLSDAQNQGDTILGVIRATSINQDGASSGFTVPNGNAQQKLIKQTLEKAGLSPVDIDYVEAHGTGTPLGDPIEAQSLGSAIGKALGRTQPLLVGSIKSNIGHLESAAGVMGLIKLLKALEHQQLPPTLHISNPSSRIAWNDLNLKPVDKLIAWTSTGSLRHASLSAFGASGSNAHLIIEEHPQKEEQASPLNAGADTMLVLALSAKNKKALNQLANAYQELSNNPKYSLADICSSANRNRDHFKYRAAICASTIENLNELLQKFIAEEPNKAIFKAPDESKRTPRIAFVFSGQGSIYAGMAKNLYEQQPVFKKSLDDCSFAFEKLTGHALLPVIFGDQTHSEDLLNKAQFAQPALFSIQYALSQLWIALGVKPSAVIGHSLGEYAAACTAGVIQLNDALALVTERGRLTDTLQNTGSMAVIFAPIQKVAPIVQPYLDTVNIAVINSDENIVIAGDTSSLKEILTQCRDLEIETHSLAVTHAFHSSLMDPILDPLEKFANGIKFSDPVLPYISCLSGDLNQISAKDYPKYWKDHYRQSVQFSKGLQSLSSLNPDVVLEISPNPILSNIGKSQLGAIDWLPSLQQHMRDDHVFARSVATLYALGLPINWKQFNFGSSKSIPTLPNYPFQRKSYWISTKDNAVTNTQMNAPIKTQDQYQIILTRLLELFSELFRVPTEEIDVNVPFLEMGADSLVLLSGARVIDDHFGVKIEIRQFFEEISTLSAIAHYLNSLNASPKNTQSVNSGVAQAPEIPSAPSNSPMPQIQAPSFTPAAPLNPVPPAALAPISLTNSTDLNQLILAQTQLMSQHLALMQSISAGQTPAISTTHTIPPSTTANIPSSPIPTKPVVEDRSSPLRALNIPITPTSANLSEQQSTFLNSLIERFQKKTPKSKALTQASRKGLADSRASIGFRFSTKEILYPITGVESTGSHIKDVDGNDYIDLTMGFGVLLFGSKPEFLNGVIEKELEHGFQLGPRSIYMEEITQLFTEITGHERVAFTNSGTEAVMIAMRLARAATGRDKIVIFEGAYNGHSDGTLAKTSVVNGQFLSEPVAPGVPINVAKDILVLEYGTPETLEIIRKHAHELAAVMVEPVQSRRLDLQPFEFLKQLRKLTEETDVALIFDEMVSGFRAHPAGVQGLIGIKADIATYGKIIGGGLPIGAVAGSGRFLDGIDGGYWQYGDASYPRATRTYFGGTFCQHPFSMATCLATLRKLKAEGPALQEMLNQRTSNLAKTLNKFFESEKIPMKVIHFASTFQFKFTGNLEMFYYLLLEKGVYIWEWRACFLSTAHTDQDIDKIIKAVKEASIELRNGGFIPSASTKPKTPTQQALAGTSSTEKEAPSERAWFRKQSKLSHNETLTPFDKSTGYQSSHLDIGIFYFGNYNAADSAGKYQLLIEGARYADANGFSSVWVPERHFDEFGGFSPNPSVLAAAIARETKNIQICAGSVVAPLHDPIRITEEWSVVDNLSDGRVGVSFASGWHPNDFVFAPDSFKNNRDLMFETIQTVRHLWSGASLPRKGGNQSDVTIKTYPRPKQKELPAWLTVVNNPDSYHKAGELGMHILTNMMGQSLDDLEKNISIYKDALAASGYDPQQARITVLIHTYLEQDANQAIEEARKPMCDYLMSSINLFQKMAEGLGPVQDINRASATDKEFIVNKAYEKYVATSALIGSPKSVEPIVDRMLQLGVTELACFIDFGVSAEKVIKNLPNVCQLKDTYKALLSQKNQSFPLAEAQKQLWLLSKLSPEGNLAYNDPAAISLKGEINLIALEQAVQKCIRRHDALRTHIDENGETQHISNPTEVELSVHDVSNDPQPEKALNDWFIEQANTPFTLNEAPLFKPTLIKLSKDRMILALSSHHIITDGPSMGIILHEIVEDYAALINGNTLPRKEATQYRDFVRWQEQYFLSEKSRSDEAFWISQFSKPIPELELPLDFPRPAIKTYKGSRAWAEINPTLLKSLRILAGKNGGTLYMVLFAAFSTLLHRLSSQDEIAIGAPYTGRSIEGSESLVGYCVHLLPILSSISNTQSFSDHLSKVKETLLQAYQHQDYPFAHLLNRLNLTRDISRAPLINYVFNLERLDESQALGNLLIEMHKQPITYTRMDLTLTANLKGEKITLECDYNTDLFLPSTINGFLESYLNILEVISKSPEIEIQNIPLLNEKEALVQLQKWNPSKRTPDLKNVVELWEKQVASHPDKVALISMVNEKRDFLTFQNLNERANQLANHLLELGVQTDQKVGICLTRSWQMVVSLLACLKAGVAYVPLDPNYPKKRLEYILKDAGVNLLVTTQTLVDQLNIDANVCCYLDSDSEVIASKSPLNPQVKTNLQNLAYVIYTSGSTGNPKGAMITHEGLSNYLTWAKDAYHADQGDGSPVLGSFSFDATITSLFVPLIAGNQVILLPDGEDLTALDALNKSPYQFSFIKITPAHLELLNSLRMTYNYGDLQLTRSLVLGGEALQGSTANPWLQDENCIVVNEYGPTETVVGCCTLATKKPIDGTMPIGKPIDGIRMYVLDDQLQLLPPGIAGDLYIGGLGLARGYLDRPAQTANAFIPDPFSPYEKVPGTRLYKTGDRARYLDNGDLVFLGRKDKQIKLNGYRIELGEIEACFSQLDQVKETVVVIKSDRSGPPKLIAYYTTSDQKPIKPDLIRANLKEQLPEYMIPTVLMHILEMPLSSHGKIDIGALPHPQSSLHSDVNVFMPGSKIEEKIFSAWQKALDTEKISRADNFFDIGGNSLLILQVFKDLEQILPTGCQVIDLFKYPTIQSLSEFISKQSINPKADSDKVISRAAKQKAATLEKANRQKSTLNKNRPNKTIEVE